MTDECDTAVGGRGALGVASLLEQKAELEGSGGVPALVGSTESSQGTREVPPLLE